MLPSCIVILQEIRRLSDANKVWELFQIHTRDSCKIALSQLYLKSDLQNLPLLSETLSFPSRMI